MLRYDFLKLFFLLRLVGLLIACSPTGNTQSALPTTVGVQETIPAQIQINNGQIRQWAVAVEAESQFAEDEWSAGQVLGAPDTARCGDYQSAWASAASDAQTWLEVRFDQAVHVTGVNVIQSFNPNQVVEVILIAADGRRLEIYNQQPSQIDRPCPYTLAIPVEQTVESYDHVRIILDQSILGLGWNEIDAVELIGVAN